MAKILNTGSANQVKILNMGSRNQNLKLKLIDIFAHMPFWHADA